MQNNTLEALWPKDRAEVLGAVDEPESEEPVAAEPVVDEQSAPAPRREAPATQEPNATAQDVPCPRCQQKIIDPHGLGWCRSCGYCKSLEDDGAQQLLAKTAQHQRGPTMAGMVGNLPKWVWVLVGGMALVMVLSLAAGQLLPAGASLSRALWTSGQIGVGLLLIFTGQFIALVAIAPEDEKLGFKDALVPTRLWHMVAKRLPRHCTSLWISCWGLTLVVAAFLFVGGLKHWFSYLPGRTPAATKTAR